MLCEFGGAVCVGCTRPEGRCAWGGTVALLRTAYCRSARNIAEVNRRRHGYYAGRGLMLKHTVETFGVRPNGRGIRHTNVVVVLWHERGSLIDSKNRAHTGCGSSVRYR